MVVIAEEQRQQNLRAAARGMYGEEGGGKFSRFLSVLLLGNRRRYSALPPPHERHVHETVHERPRHRSSIRKPQLVRAFSSSRVRSFPRQVCPPTPKDMGRGSTHDEEVDVVSNPGMNLEGNKRRAGAALAAIGTRNGEVRWGKRSSCGGDEQRRGTGAKGCAARAPRASHRMGQRRSGSA